MAKQLWSADTAEPWTAVRQAAEDTWQQHAPDKLQNLNRWFSSELPAAIAGRAPQPHITQPELVQLVDWKLSRGKWRPRLLDFAKAAKAQDVLDASTKAFSTLLASQQQQQQQQQPPSPSAVGSALAALTVLKGVGPATASALLSAADTSGSTPFMSDEALEAAVGSRSYTAKEYLQLVDALRDKADWLNTVDPGGGWTAVKVEGCLYAAQLASKGTKPTKPKAAGKQSSAVAGGTKKRGSKAAAAAASAEDAAAGAGTEKEGGMAKAAGRGSKRAKGS